MGIGLKTYSKLVTEVRHPQSPWRLPCQSKVEAVSAYTSDQAERHRRFSYREEIRKLLKRHRLALTNVFFENDAQSDALVRQSFRNTNAEKRPRNGLEVLSGRFFLGTFLGLKAWAVLFSPFGRCKCPNCKKQTRRV